MELNISALPVYNRYARNSPSTKEQRSRIDRIRQNDKRISFTYREFLNNISLEFKRPIRDICELSKSEADKVIEDMLKNGTSGFSLKKK